MVTLAAAGLSWWLIEQPIRRWRPAHLPMLRFAGATVATAAAVTMLAVPIGTRGVKGRCVRRRDDVPRRDGPVGGAAARRRLADTVSSPRLVAWTLMRYLPPTPGINFLDRTIGCGVVRGGPYRYSGVSLEQKPECDAWPERWAQRIGYDRPDVVLMVIGRWETVDRKWNGNWAHIGNPISTSIWRASCATRWTS